MALIKCPDCFQAVSDTATSCPRCGFPVSSYVATSLPETVDCLDCKKSYPLNDEVCPQCGLFNSQKHNYIQVAQHPEHANKTTTLIIKNPKSRSVAVLLAMLLGGLGLHKFYLNKPGTGILYLLFFWTFIPAIIGFFEGLGYLFMTDKKFQIQYC